MVPLPEHLRNEYVSTRERPLKIACSLLGGFVQSSQQQRERRAALDSRLPRVCSSRALFAVEHSTCSPQQPGRRHRADSNRCPSERIGAAVHWYSRLSPLPRTRWFPEIELQTRVHLQLCVLAVGRNAVLAAALTANPATTPDPSDPRATAVLSLLEQAGVNARAAVGTTTLGVNRFDRSTQACLLSSTL